MSSANAPYVTDHYTSDKRAVIRLASISAQAWSKRPTARKQVRFFYLEQPDEARALRGNAPSDA
jgi:hypothetical protein